MRAQKFQFNMAKKLKIHYERLKDDDGKIKDTSYSKINPAKSQFNYNLHDGDLVEELEEAKKEAYIKCEKEAVAFYDFCIPYPKDCSVQPKEFFENVYDICTHDRRLKYCIGAYVHMDESNPHMHYICMPIEECEEFTKSKDVKVYDEKKAREVTRRIKTSYTRKFNANKLFNKKLFNNLHEWLQKQINDRGIQGTIITPERMAFNQWKQERIEYYNSLIDKEPDKRDYYVNLFWEEYQKMNPKKYKADRPKDDRLNDFIEMTEEIKKQKEQLQLEAMAFEEAKEEIQEVMQDYIKELNDNGWTAEHFDSVINKTKYDTVMKALEIIEKLIAPLLDRLPKLFQDVMAVITGTKMKINEIDKTQNKKQFAQNIHK